jgi:hypothetical protein
MTTINRVSLSEMLEETGMPALGYSQPDNDRILVLEGLDRETEKTVLGHEFEHMSKGEEGPFWEVAIPAIASVAGGLLGAKGSKDAAKASERAQMEGIRAQEEATDLGLYMNLPGINTANVARSTLASLLGLNVPGVSTGGGGQQLTGGIPFQGGGALGNLNLGGGAAGNQFFSGRRGNILGQLQTPGTEPVDDLQAYLESTPGYQFQSQQGQKAILANARALGLGESGGTAAQLGDWVAQGVAGPAWTEHLNRLASLANTQQTQTAGSNVQLGGIGVADAFNRLGQSQAAGKFGASQAWGDAIGDLGSILGEVDWGDVFGSKSTSTASK